MTNRFKILIVAGAVALTCRTGSAQERAVRFEISAQGDVRVVTDAILKDRGARTFTQPLSPGSRPSDARAIDRTTGKVLASRVRAGDIVVDLGRALPPRAEQRVGIEELLSGGNLVTITDGRLVFDHPLPPGRAVILLPPGFAVDICSAPAQFAAENGRTKVGVINVESTAARFRLEAGKGRSRAQQLAATFRAEDDRSIVYWLDDPAIGRMTLALELLVTKPGQSHVYSVLRNQDHITDPVTLDLDRGVELQTRIVSGSEANAIGDSPTAFQPDASVLVADLGYAVSEQGSARVRLYQTATDPTEYSLTESGALKWDRFLARLRTRVVLPPGWTLESSTHSARVSRDEQQRVVLDFVQMGGDSPSLVVTATREVQRSKE
jgi:hypothetical protein